MVSVAREATAAASALGGHRMSAWRVHAYGALGELRLERARVPPLRATDELLVRVHAASINPIDVAMIGGYGRRVLNGLRALERVRGGSGGGGAGVEFPLVLGRDFAGEVAAAGADTPFARGQRVWGVVPPHWPGAHADYVVVKERWAGVAPREGRLRDAAAAGGALYAALTACSALRVAGLDGAGHGRRVLLLGLGGVGQAALQLLAARRFHVTVGCAAELAGRAAELGAVAALDRHAPDYEERLAAAGPFEAVLDCAGLGGWAASERGRRWRFERFVTLTTPLLRYVDEMGPALGAAAAAAELARQSAAAAGAAPSAAACPPPHVRWAYFYPRPDDIELLRRLAERDEFCVHVERTWPWRSAAAAYAHAANGHARGKLVIDFTADA